MKTFMRALLGAAIVVLALATSLSAQRRIGIESRFAVVNGVRLHYLIAGYGPTIILIHGYTQTSRMWRPLIPQLADKFTVIAPDLPGIGDSDIPADGLDMKNAAIRIHDLAKSLGVIKARVVGHDIGLMVAYAYAAPLARAPYLLETSLPGVFAVGDVRGAMSNV